MKKPNIMTVLVFLTGLLCIVSLFFFSWSTYRQIISTEKDVDAVSEQITAKQSEIHEAQEKYTSAVDQAQSNIDRLKQKEKNLSQKDTKEKAEVSAESSSKPSVLTKKILLYSVIPVPLHPVWATSWESIRGIKARM